MQEDFFEEKAVYIFDSSSIILLREFYPKDMFDSLHSFVSKILKSGKIGVLDLVLQELKDKEIDLHALFRDQSPKDRQLLFANYVDETQNIILNYYDGAGKSHNLKADPHIIGCAKTEGLIIVTEEKNFGSTSIPYICDKEKIKRIGFVDFLRTEGFR